MTTTLSELFGQLEAAVGLANDKRAERDAIAAEQRAIIAAAQAVTAAAARDYDTALDQAQQLRIQAQTALDDSLPALPTGVVVR